MQLTADDTVWLRLLPVDDERRRLLRAGIFFSICDLVLVAERGVVTLIRFWVNVRK